MTLKNLVKEKSLVIIITIFVSNIMMSCNRPIKCLGKKCASSVELNTPSSAGASAEATPQAPANPAQDVVLREIKGLKDSAALKTLVERVESKLESMIANNLGPLEDYINMYIFTNQVLENKIMVDGEESLKLSDISQKFGVLKSQAIQIKEQMGNLKTSEIENEGNLTFLMQSLATLLGVLDRFQEGVNNLDKGFKASLAVQLNQGTEGPDPKFLEAFKGGQKELEFLNGEILKVTGNLKNLLSSETICSLGQPLSGMPFQVKEINCSGTTFLMMSQ